MASIWPITYFWLVSATVTTSTIEALPMMTPSDVRIARNLLARRASMATERVSRTVHHGDTWFQLSAELYALMALRLPAAWFRAGSSLPLQLLERFGGAFIFRIELQRGFIFGDRGLGLALIFVVGAQATHGLRAGVDSRCEPGRVFKYSRSNDSG